MTEVETRSLARAHEKPKINTRSTARHITAFNIVAAITLLAILGGAVILLAQGDDKYSLTSPGGIAFSDFRGYEDWSVVSSARTEAELPEEILKVIVANPVMIKAFKTG